MGGSGKIFLLLALLTVIPITNAEISYFFQVQNNGETNVTIKLNESTQLPAMPDVTPNIEGGTLEKKENTLYVKTDNTAIITYISSYYTRKEKGVWHFEAKSINADNVELILPQEVHVVQSQPTANFQKEEAWKLTWENTSEATASYVSVHQASYPQKTQTKIPSNIIIGLLILAIIAYFFLAKGKAILKPKITEGQLNIMRAANANEALVVQTMLKYNGRIKRNALEKETKLSKSSLASTLKNLEKKNIVNIDRTFYVHYITLTPWFQNL